MVLVTVGGEVWCVADNNAATQPTLGEDEAISIFRQDELSTAERGRLACVSTAFAMAHDAWLREALSLQLRMQSCDDEQLLGLLQRTPALRFLEVGAEVSNDGLMEAVAAARTAHGLRQLERLDLSSSQLDASGLDWLLTTSPSLTALDMSDCDSLEEEAVSELVRRPAGRIRALSVARCAQLTGRMSVAVLCRLCGANLTELDASGYEMLDAAVIDSISLACPALRTVRLSESDGIGNAEAAQLARRCPELRSVDLSWCNCVGTDALASLCSHCSHLERLELRCCSDVEAAHAFGLLGVGCPALTLLNLNRCAHECHPEALSHSHHAEGGIMHAHMLSYGAGAASVGAANGAELTAATSCLSTTPSRLVRPLLECASLTWLDVGWLADLLDDTAAALLLQGLAMLQVLSLEGCKNLTDAALAPLLRSPPSSTLDPGPWPPAEMAGGRLLRLNCAWVDCITTDCIHNTLLAANARRTAAQLQARSQLQVLDYWGSTWGLSRGGKPVRCKLREMREMQELQELRELRELQGSTASRMGREAGIEPLPSLGWVSSWEDEELEEALNGELLPYG